MGQIATPGFAVYNGSKAFVSLFSLSLTIELKRSNIKVSCLLPGGTTTEFVEVAGVTTSRLARMGMMSSQRCAAIGLRGMFRGKAVIVPGVLNKVIHTGSGLLPGQLVGRISRWVVGKPPLPAASPSAALPSSEK
jgi:short-subunit dehydrogenase